MDIFKKLQELNLPISEYVLVGSGPLAARGIREANDLDIAVTKKLWDKLLLSKDYTKVERYGRQFLESDNVDIIKELDWEAYPTKIEEAISSADIINGYPFLNIEETIKFKKALGREKDFKDIELLLKYQEVLLNS